MMLFCSGPGAVLGQTLTIPGGIQTYFNLTTTTVSMSNRCELRITGTNNPIAGSPIHLNSPDAWFILPGILHGNKKHCFPSPIN